MSVMDVMILDVMIQNLDYFLVLRVKSADYRFCVVNMSKKDTISLLNNSVLKEYYNGFWYK